MNEETNYRQFWRSLVVAAALCVLLFWVPVGYLAFIVWQAMWEALWSLITTR
ncbi:hypothetical protein [Pluralibacter gergoviae]|uniref:hypothetical protein n=1 Tax=Pluralibacter gergoviae TaxID=61647 RepID=UPI0012D3E7DB|nr:hypothetical protein [Pluralibacter gergoviae]